MQQADPAVIANGVVFGYGSGEDATQATPDIGLPYNTAANRAANSTHATLYALDARTGEELWSSGDQITSFNHFTSLSVANGRVYIGTYDGKLYASASTGKRQVRDEQQARTETNDTVRPRGSSLLSVAASAARAAWRRAAAAREWTTSGHDAQRTAWLRTRRAADEGRRPEGRIQVPLEARVRQRRRGSSTR